MNQTTPIYILGIESSCDDTSAAVLKDGVLLSNVTASQAVHEAYGGVVPELASRAHQQNVVPVVDQAIKRAGITKEMISAIAFTRGPGLMGSLLVGVSFAKGFARSLGRRQQSASLSFPLPVGIGRKFSDCEGKCLQRHGGTWTDYR